MIVRVDVDTSDVDDELRRLRRGPDFGERMHFEIVLVSLFSHTQQAVHVITGSLKNSGAINSYMRQGNWHGEISYGGESHGAVHDPVRYAEFEQARGDLHDFMDPVYDANEGYIQAMLAWMRGKS